MKLKLMLLAVCGLLFTPSLAQHWEFEQVDTGVMRSPTIARMADGRICLSYMSEDSVVQVAFKDSAWHREVVGRMEGYASPAIAVGPHGTVGVVYDSGGICYAVRNDTEWVHERLPPAGLAPRLSYDSADVPLVVSGRTDSDAWVFASTREDTRWTTATLLCAGPGFYLDESHTAGRFSHDNVAHVFTYDYWELDLAWGSDLRLFEGYGDEWRVTRDSSLPSWGYQAWALALDTVDVPAYCFTYLGGGLYLLDQCIDTIAWGVALQFDTLNRPHIAYVASFWHPGRLKYAYRTRGTWFISEVPDTCAVDGCDLLLDSLAEPLIAYVRADGGLWLARGVDVVGQSEESKPQAASLKPQATVVRGVLLLDGDCPRTGTVPKAVLLDISGRKVLDLRVGANDVSRLARGVYFMREAQAQAIRKIIVAR